MTRRAQVACSAVSLLLGVLLAVGSRWWPDGDATAIVMLSAGSGLIAGVLIGLVVEMFLCQVRVPRSMNRQGRHD